MEEVEAYALRSQNTVAKYVATKPIMDFYEEVVRRTGTWVAKKLQE